MNNEGGQWLNTWPDGQMKCRSQQPATTMMMMTMMLPRSATCLASMGP